MSRRLEVELTSKRDDGSYTWRQAGAKQPKGSLDGSLLYEGAAVGDVVRVDADFAVDGVFITSVLPPKAKRVEKEKLEILGSGNDGGGVTTQLVGKRGRGDRDGGRGRGRGDGNKRGRGDRDGGRGRGDGDKRGRGDRDGGRGRGDGDNRGRSDGRGRSDRDGGRDGRNDSRNKRGGNPRGRGDNRPKRDQGQQRPKAKRLRPRRIHRDALLRDLPEMQRPLARIVLRDGVPGVRSIVEAQNKIAAENGQPEIPPKMLEAVGENLLPRLRAAEWRDNAEAALVGISEVDLRDIRKVVVAADNGAKDDESRALAQQLKDGLTARVEAEHGKWLSELDSLVKDGRTVRALRQSSRPPKAGSPLPAEFASRLAAAAGAAMDADTMAERWGTVLDAVAYSPVRQQVNPAALPKKVTPQLEATVKKLSKRVPHIAALFAPTPAPAAPAPKQVPPPPPVDGAPSQEAVEAPPAAAEPATSAPDATAAAAPTAAEVPAEDAAAAAPVATAEQSQESPSEPEPAPEPEAAQSEAPSEEE